VEQLAVFSNWRGNMNRNLLFSLFILGGVGLAGGAGCATDGDSSADSGPTADAVSDVGDAGVKPPLELTTQLCDDPSNMKVLLESPVGAALFASGQFNKAQVDRMIAAPTEGPFYMVNLIRYREKAQYPDGRQTDLTGREANGLYNPSEFIAAIGARVVFNTEVDNQIDGDDIKWQTVAIVEYPCPVAFFAMLAHPDFQARAIHKTAGVEKTIVMVTDLVPSFPPQDPDQSEAKYPPTKEDPAFTLIHVMDFHDIAQYEPGANEPQRTGKEAWQAYQAAGQGASSSLGHYSPGHFLVQGVFTGDERSWDEIQLVRMSSQAGFQALLDDPTRQAGKHHRLAALAHNYSMITFPTLSEIPTGGGVSPAPVVTADGTGTICKTDSDCPGKGVDKCLSDGSAAGFCTREGCAAGECQSPYLCCHDCAAAVAPMLPFKGSACLPKEAAAQLTAAPVSCTCD
jgi:hypothetical protein